MSIENIIQNIFQSHANGINFREWNAGKEIDNLMLNEGFNIKINLDNTNGFIYGGNNYNNGTWMDKLINDGKNKGIPYNNRSGADIEIICLLYNCLEFIIDIGNKGYYQYKSVLLENGINFPYSQWILLIKDNFEKEFFVSKKIKNIENKEYIYKDYVSYNNNYNNGDGNNRKEYQLRPNALFGIIIAEDLFSANNVNKFLNNVEKYLFDVNKHKDNNNIIINSNNNNNNTNNSTNNNDNNNNNNNENNENNNNNEDIDLFNINENKFKIMGIKTLDKTDKEYRGLHNKYENNVHNGIEYIWLYAYYLLVKIKYTKWNNDLECIKYISKKLIPLQKYIENSQWMGLPEMIDENGNVINDVGNETSLNSICCIYEVLEKLAKKGININNDINNFNNDNNDDDDE